MFLAEKTIRSLVNNVVFFPKLPFLGYLPGRIRLFGVPGSSGAAAASREFSRCAFCQRRAAMLCPKSTAHLFPASSQSHFLTPQSGSFVVRNGQRDTANSSEYCTWNGSWIHGFYLKMPQQPKEFHIKAALPHWKFRVSFSKYWFLNLKYFFSVRKYTSAPCTCSKHCNLFSFQRLKAWGFYFSYCLLSHRSHRLLRYRCCPVCYHFTWKSNFFLITFNFPRRQLTQRQDKPLVLLYIFIYSLKDLNALAHN